MVGTSLHLSAFTIALVAGCQTQPSKDSGLAQRTATERGADRKVVQLVEQPNPSVEKVIEKPDPAASDVVPEEQRAVLDRISKLEEEVERDHVEVGSIEIPLSTPQQQGGPYNLFIPPVPPNKLPANIQSYQLAPGQQVKVKFRRKFKNPPTVFVALSASIDCYSVDHPNKKGLIIQTKVTPGVNGFELDIPQVNADIGTLRFVWIASVDPAKAHP